MASGVFSHSDLEMLTKGGIIGGGGGGGVIDTSLFLKKENDNGKNYRFSGSIVFPDGESFELSYSDYVNDSIVTYQVDGKAIVDGITSFTDGWGKLNTSILDEYVKTTEFESVKNDAQSAKNTVNEIKNKFDLKADASEITTINSKIEELETNIETNTENIEKKVDKTELKDYSKKSEIDEIKNSIDGAELNITSINTEIQTMKDDISTLRSGKVSTTAFDEYKSKNEQDMEKKYAQKTELDDYLKKSDIGENGKIDLTDYVTKNDLKSINSSISTNTTNISTNTTNIAKKAEKTVVDGLTLKMTTVQNDITALQSSVKTNTSNIATKADSTTVGEIRNDVDRNSLAIQDRALKTELSKYLPKEYYYGATATSKWISKSKYDELTDANKATTYVKQDLQPETIAEDLFWIDNYAKSYTLHLNKSGFAKTSFALSYTEDNKTKTMTSDSICKDIISLKNGSKNLNSEQVQKIIGVMNHLSILDIKTGTEALGENNVETMYSDLPYFSKNGFCWISTFNLSTSGSIKPIKFLASSNDLKTFTHTFMSCAQEAKKRMVNSTGFTKKFSINQKLPTPLTTRAATLTTETNENNEKNEEEEEEYIEIDGEQILIPNVEKKLKNLNEYYDTEYDILNRIFDNLTAINNMTMVYYVSNKNFAKIFRNTLFAEAMKNFNTLEPLKPTVLASYGYAEFNFHIEDFNSPFADIVADGKALEEVTDEWTGNPIATKSSLHLDLQGIKDYHANHLIIHVFDRNHSIENGYALTKIDYIFDVKLTENQIICNKDVIESFTINLETENFAKIDIIGAMNLKLYPTAADEDYCEMYHTDPLEEVDLNNRIVIYYEVPISENFKTYIENLGSGGTSTELINKVNTLEENMKKLKNTFDFTQDTLIDRITGYENSTPEEKPKEEEEKNENQPKLFSLNDEHNISTLAEDDVIKIPETTDTFDNVMKNYYTTMIRQLEFLHQAVTMVYESLNETDNDVISHTTTIQEIQMSMNTYESNYSSLEERIKILEEKCANIEK